MEEKKDYQDAYEKEHYKAVYLLILNYWLVPMHRQLNVLPNRIQMSYHPLFFYSS